MTFRRSVHSPFLGYCKQLANRPKPFASICEKLESRLHFCLFSYLDFISIIFSVIWWFFGICNFHSTLSTIVWSLLTSYFPLSAFVSVFHTSSLLRLLKQFENSPLYSQLKKRETENLQKPHYFETVINIFRPNQMLGKRGGAAVIPMYWFMPTVFCTWHIAILLYINVLGLIIASKGT